MRWIWWELANVTWAGTAVCQRVKYTNSSRICAARYGAATRNAPTNASSTWNQIWIIPRFPSPSLLFIIIFFFNKYLKHFQFKRAANIWTTTWKYKHVFAIVIKRTSTVRACPSRLLGTKHLAPYCCARRFWFLPFCLSCFIRSFLWCHIFKSIKNWSNKFFLKKSFSHFQLNIFK